MKQKGAMLLPAVLIAGAAYEYLEHAVVARRKYTVEVPEPLAGLKLLLLSDLHCNPFLCGSRRLQKRLAAEHPDVILLAGDMFSKYGKSENERVPDFLRQLTAIAPVVACPGNHEAVLKEQFPKQYEAFLARMKADGIYFLDNTSVGLQLKGREVDFCGFSVSLRYYFRKWKRLHLSDKECSRLPKLCYDRTILLAHHPDFFEEYQRLSPLIVSGHVHGGIMRLPFFGGVLSPQLYKPPYSHGCYRKDGSTLVVSSGIGSHSIPLRIFNRVEYCMIYTKQRNKT